LATAAPGLGENVLSRTRQFLYDYLSPCFLKETPGAVIVPTPEPIIPLEPSQKDQAARVICQAFKDDPAGTYFTADPTRRAFIYSWLAHVGLTLGLKYGEIFTTPQVDGCAVWIRPGTPDLSLWDLAKLGLFPPVRAGLAALRRFTTMMAVTSEAHQQFAPENHWYLFILAVSPALQGQGLGGRLIHPILERADAAGLPCYLETMNPRALPFYDKHGFKLVHQAHLPDSATPFWGLRRKPR
jgi:ribosomal protein S18 acetylase RimI-like enzyme